MLSTQQLQAYIRGHLPGKLAELRLSQALVRKENQSSALNTCWFSANPLENKTSNELVIRQRNPSAITLGVDQNLEATIHNAAAAIGLSPPLLYADNTVFITEALTAEPLDQRCLKTENNFLALIDTVKATHSLKVQAPIIDWLTHEDNYWQQLKPQHPYKTLLAPYRNKLLDILSEEFIPTLCHHDLSAGNILLSNKRLYLIDWEYAKRGNPLWDIASICQHWKLNTQQRSLLLSKLYPNQSEPSQQQGLQQQLKQWQAVVVYINLLWNALALPATFNHIEPQDLKTLNILVRC